MKEDDFLLRIILEELEKINGKGIIPFPKAYMRLGTVFHFTKPVAKKVLKLLESRGMIEIIPFHGVRLKAQRFSK